MKYLALLALLAACGNDPEQPAIDAAVLPDTLSPPDLPRTMGEDQLAPQRAACAFDAGAWPAETIGTEDPLYGDIPIDHIIVIMQENRSFDNYFGRLVADGFYQDGEVDVPPAGWQLPDGAGGFVTPHPDTQFCFGVNHGWNDMHDDWDNGANDHFVTNNNPGGDRTMTYEDETVIPFYYALADKFAIGDRYFASVLSSTWPNRYFLMGATSFGIGDNSFRTEASADEPDMQIFRYLDYGGHTWKDYTDGPHQLEFYIPYGFDGDTQRHYGDVKCDLFADIDGNALPDVAFVMGDEVNGEMTDEGPSALPGIGGALVEDIVRHVMASPAWAHTAIFITYDENGGMADHVPPAPACPPDGFAPHDGHDAPLDGAFDTTGFRVPFIVVSPYAKAHYVSHVVYDHTSITRFIEARFGLPALSARDANATPPFDLFDFSNPPFATPPEITAHTTVPDEVLTGCGQLMAPACEAP